jgi:hypothetical protein
MPIADVEIPVQANDVMYGKRPEKTEEDEVSLRTSFFVFFNRFPSSFVFLDLFLSSFSYLNVLKNAKELFCYQGWRWTGAPRKHILLILLKNLSATT